MQRLQRPLLARSLVLAILATSAISLAGPARAQTYDPNYPVCLQIYEDIAHFYFECGFRTMGQCMASASGRSAQCVVNPYYGKASGNPGARKKRSRQ